MKRILVTGAAQGIGRAITKLLLKDVANKLIVIDKQKTEFIEDCEGEYAQRFNFFQQDLAQRSGLAKILTEISKQPLDGIVNNAGEVYLEKWDELDMATWDRTLAVNLGAPLQIVHSLRNVLRKDSSVVNIASTDGQCAAFDTVAYAASKAGLINLTQSMAAILGPKGIRVNAIAPGWVETDMTEETLPEEAAWMTPLGRNAKASDVADAVDFLLSERSSFISGQTINVDGGLTIVDYTLKKESEHVDE